MGLGMENNAFNQIKSQEESSVLAAFTPLILISKQLHK